MVAAVQYTAAIYLLRFGSSYMPAYTIQLVTYSPNVIVAIIDQIEPIIWSKKSIDSKELNKL